MRSSAFATTGTMKSGLNKRGAGLDFYECVKLVNYLRSEVQRGNTKPDVSSKSLFDDDVYLKPVLEDDALLFSLDGILQSAKHDDKLENGLRLEPAKAVEQDAFQRITDLEAQLQQLSSQFANYRLAVGKTLDERWDDREGNTAASTTPEQQAHRNDDTHYFDSYAYNGMTVFRILMLSRYAGH